MILYLVTFMSVFLATFYESTAQLLFDYHIELSDNRELLA